MDFPGPDTLGLSCSQEVQQNDGARDHLPR
jgi:hypothetical protein